MDSQTKWYSADCILEVTLTGESHCSLKTLGWLKMLSFFRATWEYNAIYTSLHNCYLFADKTPNFWHRPWENFTWLTTDTSKTIENGFLHVTRGAPEAVHQLRVGEKHHHQEGGKEEPVCPQKQLHPQEERQQEEKPSLQHPESPGLVAQTVPGWTEERKVQWLTRKKSKL